jgi:biopolymer transport protein ExbD
MKKRSRHHHGTVAELNITPLLDLVFVLLVIFIITTPQMMNNLEMTLPSAHPPPPKANEPEPKINKIVIDDQGRTFLNDEEMIIPVLRDRLRQLKTTEPDPVVVVNGADHMAYQYMVSVLDILRELDITKVGLATQGIAPIPADRVPSR